jgi:hypothetical protein
MRAFRPLLIAAFVITATLVGSPVQGAAKPAKPPKPAKKPAPPKRAHPQKPAPPHRGPKPHHVAKPGHHPAHPHGHAHAHPPKREHPKPKHETPQKVKPPHADHRRAHEQKHDKPKKLETVKKPKPLKERAHELVRRERIEKRQKFVHFNERTGECSFDAQWWYNFVVYPGTVSRVQAAQADYVTMVPPANVVIAPPVIAPRQGLPVSAEGAALAALLDGMDVENHWIAGQPVDWKTGNAVDRDGTTNNGGALVAAIAARVKVPMPPPVLENFAAGEQYDWLLDQGPAKGWVLVGDMEAQLLANQGWLVIAAWKDPAPAGARELTGQTAIVRPDGRPAAEIHTRGPRIIEAGPRNHNNIALKDGFPAKAGKDVVYFAHRPR